MPRPPSPGNWTNRYGPRVNPVTGRRETHHGLDIGHAAGRTLVAPEPGRLVAYGVPAGWSVHGRVAQFQGDSGYLHWLSHTQALLAGVKVGNRYAEGAPLAQMGATGQVTGVHVHWETRRNGLRLDPEGWLTRFASTTQTPKPDPTPDPDDESEEDPMLFARLTETKAPNGDYYYAFIAPGYYHEWWGLGAANQARKRYGEPIPVGRSWLNAARAEAQAGRTTPRTVQIVVDADEGTDLDEEGGL